MNKQLQPRGPLCSICGIPNPKEDLVEIVGHLICFKCKPGFLGKLTTGHLDDLELKAGKLGPPWEIASFELKFTAFFDTIWQALTRPNRFFSHFNRSGGYGSPMVFGFISTLLFGFLDLIYRIILHFVEKALKMDRLLQEQEYIVSFAVQASAIEIGHHIIHKICLPFTVFVAILIAHALIETASRKHLSFESTFRTFWYAYGISLALFSIPIAGSFFVTLVFLALCAVGMHRLNGTSIALNLVLTLPALLLGYFVSGLVTNLMMLFFLSGILQR